MMRLMSCLFFTTLLLFMGCGFEVTNGNDVSLPPGNIGADGYITAAKVIGSLDDIEINDSVKLDGSFQSSASVDTSKIDYLWNLEQDSTTLIEWHGKSFDQWVPQIAGHYMLTLTVSYEGRNAKHTMIVVVIEKVVYVDSNQQTLLKQYIDSLSGYYVGKLQ
jgi:hypothetical protein